MSVIPFVPQKRKELVSADQTREWNEGIDRLKSRKISTFAPGGLVRAQRTILHLESLLEQYGRD